MTDIDDEDDDDLEEYEPHPAIVGDGDVLVADPVELLELTNAVALQVRDGGLFVLKRDTLKWANVEDAVKASRSTVVRAVPTKQ